MQQHLVIARGSEISSEKEEWYWTKGIGKKESHELEIDPVVIILRECVTIALCCMWEIASRREFHPSEFHLRWENESIGSDNDKVEREKTDSIKLSGLFCHFDLRFVVLWARIAFPTLLNFISFRKNERERRGGLGKLMVRSRFHGSDICLITQVC